MALSTATKWVAGTFVYHNGDQSVDTYKIKVLDRPKSYLYEGDFCNYAHLGAFVGYKRTFLKVANKDLFDSQSDALKALEAKVKFEIASCQNTLKILKKKRDAVRRRIKALKE